MGQPWDEAMTVMAAAAAVVVVAVVAVVEETPEWVTLLQGIAV